MKIPLDWAVIKHKHLRINRLRSVQEGGSAVGTKRVEQNKQNTNSGTAPNHKK